ncbi:MULTISPECIES: hypothetical protein [Sphingopyxis]|uniref:hypothetical protein n=1 Tax=Sphingopyxis TaxID=165697 RepID=UPI0007376231|nr:MULTISPECIES: hypothetical protein [Sphingopyxis]KTE37775.1 hypothetical protein ATE62_12720 [Sphingopyxis sp. HIX]
MPSLAQRVENFKERLRFRFMPPIADWLAWASTYQARQTLGGMQPMRLLVDNTVLYHAVTHETAWISTGKSKWGPHEIDTGYSARVPVHDDDTDGREHRNVRFLAGIAQLCRNGFVELLTSAELQDEQFRQPAGRYRGYGYFDHSLFARLQIESVDGHVFPHLGPSWMRLPSAEEQQRARIDRHRQDEAFDELVRTLGQANSQDAWHLYTADKFGIHAFLTMDFKFIRTVEAQARSAAVSRLKARVMSPEMLGKELGLFPLSPRLFSYHDASFFVRTDLSMPSEKRRPLNGYRRTDR